jgi:type IV secretion system protein VirB1
MQSLVHQESAFNPYAIGMDAKQGAVKQPTNLAEAVETVQKLKKEGRSFSVGLAQIHISNLERYGMTWEQAFEPCVNLHTSELILWDFYKQALKSGYEDSGALWAMLRGYNSGNIHAPVSNKYASDILNRAVSFNQNLVADMKSAVVVSTKVNYQIPKIQKQEGDKDIFEENNNTKDIFSGGQ